MRSRHIPLAVYSWLYQLAGGMGRYQIDVEEPKLGGRAAHGSRKGKDRARSDKSSGLLDDSDDEKGGGAVALKINEKYAVWRCKSTSA